MWILVLILLILVFFIIYRRRKLESFDLYNPYYTGEFEIPSNQNYDAVWKKDNVADKNIYLQKIPILNNQLELSHYLDHYDISYKKGLIDMMKVLKTLETPSKSGINSKKINVDEIKLLNANFKTWKPNNDTYINSENEDINKLNELFIKKLNEKQRIILKDKYIINFGLSDFKIINYKIKNVYEDNKYGLIIMLYRETDYYLPVIYYEGKLPNIIQNIDLIGYYPTSDYLMNQGFDNQKRYYNLNQDILQNNEDNILIRDVFINNAIRKKYLDKFKITNQYACFNNNGDIIKSLDENNCKQKYDWYGRPKQSGIYDTPCKEDKECIFYGMNKNYKNEFGKCIRGYCELPLGLDKRGYHYYKSGQKPLCYNCNNKNWQVKSDLGNCCDEQYSKEKYPFLNGPDFAFKNDYEQRFNHFIQQKYLKEKNK